jgi:hypothetical protein
VIGHYGCAEKQTQETEIVAKFSSEQSVAVTAIQQLIGDWAHDLDVHNGLHVPDLVTENCIYHVGGFRREGRVAVGQHYRDRLERLAAQPSGLPLQRHLVSNLRVSFRSESEVSITFGLLYFMVTGASGAPVPTLPVAVADVRMECQRCDDDEWRISAFDSNQTFVRAPV